MKTCYQTITFLVVFILFNANALAEKMDNYRIYTNTEKLVRANIIYPTWFKTSFYDLPDDLNDARDAGKRGIIVFFSQKNCNHCQAFIEATFKDPAVEKRVRANYDVIHMEIFSDVEVTDIDGSITSVKDFVDKHRAYLTPTVLFYGVENARLLKILGFYPPEKFQKVLDYIDGGHYKTVKLNQYLHNKQLKKIAARSGSLMNDNLFITPPYDTLSVKTETKLPTLVLFETPNCHACRRFHDRVLRNANVRKKLPGFQAIQLNSSDNTTKVTTPDGRQLTPKQWFKELQLVYDVSTVFFNEQGKEVHRNDAETGIHRMAFTMDYVLEKGYLEEKQVNRWRREKIRSELEKVN